MHVHSLQAKPSAVEPENAQPALTQMINKNISSLKNMQERNSGQQIIPLTPFSLLGQGEIAKGATQAEGYCFQDLCATVRLKSTFLVTPLPF